MEVISFHGVRKNGRKRGRLRVRIINKIKEEE